MTATFTTKASKLVSPFDGTVGSVPKYGILTSPGIGMSFCDQFRVSTSLRRSKIKSSIAHEYLGKSRGAEKTPPIDLIVVSGLSQEKTPAAGAGPNSDNIDIPPGTDNGTIQTIWNAVGCYYDDPMIRLRKQHAERIQAQTLFTSATKEPH